MARATSSLPTPLSPVMSTVAVVGAARLTASSTRAGRAALADELVPHFLRLAQRDVLVDQAQPVERVADRDEHALASTAASR